jgi:hypothetical protein
MEILGEPSARQNLRVWEWIKESKVAAVAWTAIRIWLGIMWIQAGVARLWGAENPGFLHNNGAGVAGFAAHGVPGLHLVGPLPNRLRRSERGLDRRPGGGV